MIRFVAVVALTLGVAVGVFGSDSATDKDAALDDATRHFDDLSPCEVCRNDQLGFAVQTCSNTGSPMEYFECMRHYYSLGISMNCFEECEGSLRCDR
ncbi:MAG: hypothetical protein ISN28_09385 [Ectothiorhodospiraceae bacterium AqS1]|nr:hypothetical protein [Ectothiorhodospiraceae bacterium AqS1]